MIIALITLAILVGFVVLVALVASGSTIGSSPCGRPLIRAGRMWRSSSSCGTTWWIGTAFVEVDVLAAHAQWRTVADRLRPRVLKLAALMDATEHDVLAYMDCPRKHCARLHSINPIERLNGEIKRRTDVVGIFPNKNWRRIQ